MLSEMVVRDLAEQALLERALSGDSDADTEVGARAMAGSFRCQVGLLHALAVGYMSGQFSTAYYLERAEVLARLSASTGDVVERRRLAAVLDVKAMHLREIGSDNASKTAHIECAIILNRLADEGDDEAVSMLDKTAPDMHPDALQVANMGLRAVRPFLRRPTPSPPPLDLSGLMSPDLDMPEPTRGQRFWWWLSDRWCAVPFWFEDRAWAVKLKWWALQDWIAERKAKA